MNRTDLIKLTTDKVKNDGFSKPITIPRNMLTVKDEEGNECKFHIRRVDKSVAYNQRDVTLIIDTFLGLIEDSLSRGDSVELYGFGVFKPHHRAARKSINPISKEVINVEARYVPKFTPGKNLKLAVKLYDLSQKERGE